MLLIVLSPDLKISNIFSTHITGGAPELSSGVTCLFSNLD